jgi:hypothetical protein
MQRTSMRTNRAGGGDISSVKIMESHTEDVT